MSPEEAMTKVIARIPLRETELMEPQVESHLNWILKEQAGLTDPKYRKGQREHGEHLYEKSVDYLLRQSIDEAIDQNVYLLTLQQRLQGFIARLNGLVRKWQERADERIARDGESIDPHPFSECADALDAVIREAWEGQ